MRRLLATALIVAVAASCGGSTPPAPFGTEPSSTFDRNTIPFRTTPTDFARIPTTSP
jgi:hypothetical protein